MAAVRTRAAKRTAARVSTHAGSLQAPTGKKHAMAAVHTRAAKRTAARVSTHAPCPGANLRTRHHRGAAPGAAELTACAGQRL